MPNILDSDSTVVIYGASDDLVYAVGGGNDLEFSYDPDAKIVVVGQAGQVVEVRPILHDDWNATVMVVQQGSSVAQWEIVPRPDIEWFGRGDQGVAVNVGPLPLIYKAVDY